MVVRELRLGLRILARSPGFLTLSVLTLSLGIAAAAILFSLTESVLWRPFSFAGSERLVVVSERNLKRPAERGSVSIPNFRDWRERLRTVDGLAAMTWGESHNLNGPGISERVTANSVTVNFFETLGTQPALGRAFGAAEEQGGSRTVILSHEFWRRAFESSPGVIGRNLKLDGASCTVVGVMPAGFHLEFLDDPDVFLSLSLAGPGLRREVRSLAAIGRLRPGHFLPEAQAEIDTVAAGMAAEHPEANANWGGSVESLHETFTVGYRHGLYLYLGFSGLVLLIACANVAGLLLVHFVGRQREFALRTALGASRVSLLRQTIAETAWIAVPGGVLGAILASWGIAALRAILPAGEYVRSAQISMGPRTLLFVLGVSLASTFLFALASATGGSRLHLDAALRDWGKTVAGDRGTGRRIDLLIAAEVALAFLLLFGAALFLGSDARLHQVQLGFDPRGVVTMRMSPGAAAAENPETLRSFYRDVLQRARTATGIESAALGNALPLMSTSNVYVTPADRDRPAHGDEPRSLARVVSPDYFHVLGVPLLAGRTFTDQDSASSPRVAVVNENLARRFFGTADPVGKQLSILAGGNPAIPVGNLQIVGLAANTKEVGIDEVVFLDLYLPFTQAPQRTMWVAAKTSGRLEAVVGGLRHDLQTLDPEGALYNLAGMEQRISASLAGERYNLTLVLVFAGLAVLLAGVGIYGAIGFSVAQRTREFGLRMALGAPPLAVLRLTLRRTARLTLGGAACGLGLALVLGALLKKALYLAPGEHGGMLYGVGIHDPASLAGATILMLVLAAIAGLLPAARASQVDPLAALRHD